MIRALSILAAVAALAVSAAPVGSAGLREAAETDSTALVSLKKPPPRSTVVLEEKAFDFALKAAPPKAGPSKARVGGKMHLEDISLGVKPKPKPLAEEMTEALHAIRR